MAKAIKLHKDNLEFLIEDAKILGFDISHIHDSFALDAADGGSGVYLIRGGDVEANNITYTEMGSEDFHNNWRFLLNADWKYTFETIVPVQ